MPELAGSIRALADAAHSATSVDEYLAEALETLAHRLGFDNAVVFSPAVVDGPPFVFQMSAGGRAILDGFLQGFKRYRLLPEQACRLAMTREAVTVHEVLASLGVRPERDPFCNEVLRPLAISSVIDVALRHGPDVLGFLSLHRLSTPRVFSSRELKLARTLAPVFGLGLAALRARLDVSGRQGLTRRLAAPDREVAAYAGRGLSDPEIAWVTGTTARAAHDQVEAVAEALSVSRRSGLATVAGVTASSERSGAPAQRPAGPHRESIERAARYLRERCVTSLSVEEAARVAAMSTFHFLRVFKETLGRTPYQYVLDCRIALAEAALAHVDLSIKEVAHACGFGSSSHFVATFRRRLGLTPAAYRMAVVAAKPAPAGAPKAKPPR